jgi:nucleotide-binding universal stress UspA family protein
MTERENQTTPTRPVGSPFHPRDADDAIRPEEDPAARARGSEDRPTRSIIVGIDGSPECRAALHWAVREAEETGGEIDAVAVWQQPLQFGISAAAPVPEQAFRDEAHQWLADAMPASHTGEGAPVKIRTKLERGDPSTVLLDHALRADMLVLGNKGRGGFSGAMVGSVALRCARNARCPVVLVPAPPTPDETPPR